MLSVFYEFCRPDILEQVKKLNIKVDQSSQPLNDKSPILQKIYRTNAKSFDMTEETLAQLKSIGFTVVNIEPMIRKEKRMIMVEDETVDVYRKCECGNDIKVPQLIKKEMMIDVIYECHDRIILQIDDL